MFAIPDFLRQQSAVTSMRVAAGQFLYKPTDESPFIFLIDTGAVKIGSLGPLGERVTYDLLLPGETFGNLHYLDSDGVEFFEFAQAATAASLLAVELAYFRHIIIHDPVVAEWFNRVVVRRWCKAETRLLHMAHADTDTRLQALQRAYNQSITDADGRVHNALRLLSYQEMADLTGTTRQTVSKKLNRQPVR
ncbi:Crp/Fnr family transcriptional regulator [Spirosoma luteolum]